MVIASQTTSLTQQTIDGRATESALQPGSEATLAALAAAAEDYAASARAPACLV